MLGFPVDTFKHVDVEFFRAFVHPMRSYRRWIGVLAMVNDDFAQYWSDICELPIALITGMVACSASSLIRC